MGPVDRRIARPRARTRCRLVDVPVSKPRRDEYSPHRPATTRRRRGDTPVRASLPRPGDWFSHRRVRASDKARARHTGPPSNVEAATGHRSSGVTPALEDAIMVVRVTCAGVLIGTAQFDPPHGLAHASLSPTSDYAFTSAGARALGRELALTRCWCPRDGDFADVAAARWTGGRLALEDTAGREIEVGNVVVLEGSPRGPSGRAVRVVADFRPDLARVQARVRTRGADGGGCTRPAA